MKPSNPPFEQEHQGTWGPSMAEYRLWKLAHYRLWKLAHEYHERTEAYDRTVCTGPIIHGGIMPKTQEQRSLINHHAKAVFNELRIEAARLGFAPKQWLEAVQTMKRTPDWF